MPTQGANATGTREGTVGGWLPATVFSTPYYDVNVAVRPPACTRGQNFEGETLPNGRISQPNMTRAICEQLCVKNADCAAYFMHDQSCSAGDPASDRFCVLKASVAALNPIIDANCTCGAQMPVRPTVFRVERVSFAGPEPASAFVQHPVWHRFLNVSNNGTINSATYINSYLPFPNKTGPPAADFYQALFDLHRYWATSLNTSTAEATVTYQTAARPEFLAVRGKFIRGDEFCDVQSTHADAALLRTMSQSSVVREMITRRGYFFPRYGVPPSHYGMDYGDGFQDTVNSAVNSALNLGLLGSASGYLSNYLEFYTLPGARIVYRSPETAQFGRFLSTVARHYELTGDASLILQHFGDLKDIGDMLILARHRALLLPASDAAYGLIHGNDEADVLLADEYSGTNIPYFDASMEAWRGFIEFAHAITSAGAGDGDRRDDLVGYGKVLLSEAAALAKDVEVALERSAFVEAGGNRTCLPYVAGVKSCSLVPKSMMPGCVKCNRESEPFRGFSGMYYSGFLTSAQAQTIAEWNLNEARMARLGMWGGPPDFNQHMSTFTEVGHGFGLLQQGRINEFLLVLFSTAKHGLSRGTFTAPESRTLSPRGEGGEGEPPGYASPAQQLLPQLYRWALVYEEKAFMASRRLAKPGSTPLSTDNAVDVHLARGVPRQWLAKGERLAVKRVPTSGGNVSYALIWAEDGTAISASVELTKAASTACPLRTIWLHLRLPPQYSVKAVELRSKPFAGYDAAEQAIALSARDLVGGAADMHILVTETSTMTTAMQ